MVKFGRHCEFYQHSGHELYVVPYNEIKGRCIYERSPKKKKDKRRGEIRGEGPVSPTADVDEDREEEKRREDEAEIEEADEEAAADLYFCREKFKTNWRSCLALASRDFERSTRRFWSDVFGGIIAASTSTSSEYAPTIDPAEIRGALPDTALRLYLQIASDEQVQTLYTNLKDVHSTALINSEALRKLVKKFDKDVDRDRGEKLRRGATATTSNLGAANGNGHRVHAEEEDMRLSGKLLPEVYSANFNLGLPTVEAGLAAIAYRLGLDDEDEDDEHDREVQAARIKLLGEDSYRPGDLGSRPNSPDPLADAEDLAGFFGLTMKRRDSDAILVEKRKLELTWLRSLVENIGVMQEAEGMAGGVGGVGGVGGAVSMIGCLVGHRGFHSIRDRSDKRPMENSLMAYEAAWTNGIHLCECDIALTKDDRLILAHDENFTRLALDPTDPLVQRNVRSLTYKEILSLPLKSGCRPPLLFDVLRSAHFIGGEARMIVEIKPGNCEAGTALAKMFARHPELMERTAVVMSFDAFAMQNLRRELELVFPTTSQQPLPNTTSAISVNASPDLDLLPLTVAPPPAHHGHRRGISAVGGSGVIPNIPTAMSIGDMHSLAAAVQSFEVGGPGGLAATSSFEGKERSGSVDQLGMSLDGMGPRKDSFRFTPFGQLGKAPLSLSGSGHGQLIPPINPQQPIAKPLETIPGGVRVEDAAPHPGGAKPPLATAKPPLAGEAKPPLAEAKPPLAEPVGPPKAMTVVIPKLLLITRNGPAQNEEQKDALKVDVTDPSDVSRVSSWMQGRSPHERLDGLYMQYQPCMIDSPEGVQAMMALTDHYTVGIWGANPKRDDYETFSRLVKDCGVSYFNSGLPKKFLRKARRDSGSTLMDSSAGAYTAEQMMELNSRTWPRRPQTAPAGHLPLPW